MVKARPTHYCVASIAVNAARPLVIDDQIFLSAAYQVGSALLKVGAAAEAETLLDALPANLATDDRAVKARARLGFAALLKDAPPAVVLEQAIAANPDDLRARHLLGARCIVEGDSEAGLVHFLEMLKRNRAYEDGLPKKALIDAFRVVDDEDLVGVYRRKMATVLF